MSTTERRLDERSAARTPIVIHSRGMLPPTTGMLLTCPRCKEDSWHIYFILGEYKHLQCRGCERTFCGHEGPCQPVEEN